MKTRFTSLRDTVFLITVIIFVSSFTKNLSAACDKPTGLSTTNITSTSAKLNWTAVSGANSYNIRYRKTGTTSWTLTTSTTNSKTLSSLVASTSYQFKVRAFCSSGNSTFSSIATFTTAGATCSVPSGLSASSVTTSSATLNWSAVSGAISYNIHYRVSGSSSWTNTTSSSNSKSISSLTSGTIYEFQVQTVCSGSTGSYSSSATFTTSSPSCSTPSGLSASNITSSSATLNWSTVSGAVSYNIHYRIFGASSWTSTTSSSNSKNISSLSSSNTYEFQVQTVCSSTSSSYSSSSTFATSGTVTIPRPDHIVICIMENHAYSQIIGNTSAPRINALANDAMSASFTQAYGIEHPSQPNYLDLFSGSNQGMTNNNVPASHFTTPNLARELLNVGRTFVSYSDGLPSVGYDGASSGSYMRKHNPITNWMGSGTNQVSSSLNQPFTAFPSNFSSLPTVSFVVPNQMHDMHDGTIEEGDAWVYNNLNEYIQWAKGNNSLFILTFDEDDGAHSNQIVTIFTGAMVLGGHYSTHINHYNVLRTIEEMYGTTHAGSAASATPIHGIWTNDYRLAEARTDLEWEVSPNPFNDEVKVTYALQHAASVSISVFNIIGEIVFKKEYDAMPEGMHDLKIDFSGTRLKSEIYFTRLTVDGISYTKKIMKYN